MTGPARHAGRWLFGRRPVRPQRPRRRAVPLGVALTVLIVVSIAPPLLAAGIAAAAVAALSALEVV